MKWPFLSKLIPAPVNRRRAERIRARGDSFARVDGKDSPVWSWSTYGMSCSPYSGALKPGQRAKIRLVLKEIPKHSVLELDVEITVRRVGYNELAFEFYRLPPRVKQQIHTYYQNVLARKKSSGSPVR